MLEMRGLSPLWNLNSMKQQRLEAIDSIHSSVFHPGSVRVGRKGILTNQDVEEVQGNCSLLTWSLLGAHKNVLVGRRSVTHMGSICENQFRLADSWSSIYIEWPLCWAKKTTLERKLETRTTLKSPSKRYQGFKWKSLLIILRRR